MDKDMRNKAPRDFSPKREYETQEGPPDKKCPKGSRHMRILNAEKVPGVGDGSFSDERRKAVRSKKIAALGASVIFILGLAVTRELIRPPETGISTKEAWQVMSELNAAENTGEMGFAEAINAAENTGEMGFAEAIETETTTPQPEISEEEKAGLISQGEDSMKKQIFGDEENQGISPYLTITGMTDKEKRDAGFVETDFLRAAGLFLKDRGISSKRIIVENPVDCSLPNGMAFQGRLEKVDDMSFRFILFPNLPGEYIFMIEEDEEKVQPETLTTEDASDTEEQAAGTQTQAAVQTQNPPQTQSQPQSQASQDTDYDARNISISSVPEELLNYMEAPFRKNYSTTWTTVMSFSTAFTTIFSVMERKRCKVQR